MDILLGNPEIGFAAMYAREGYLVTPAHEFVNPKWQAKGAREKGTLPKIGAQRPILTGIFMYHRKLGNLASDPPAGAGANRYSWATELYLASPPVRHG
jgi:hypothetical protein